MFRLAILGIAVVGVVFSVTLGFLTLVNWEVSSILVTASIGIPSLVLAYLSLKEKSAKQTKSMEKAEKHEQGRQPRTVLEETCIVDAQEHVSYDLDLKKGEELKGKIASHEKINFFFLTKYGLTRFKNNKDFSYEYGSESVLESKIHFTPIKTGTLYLVIENEGRDQATVDIHLFV
jgi:hypothetical protein